MTDSIRDEVEELFAELVSFDGDAFGVARELGLRVHDARHTYLTGKPSRGGARPHPPQPHHPKRSEAMAMLDGGVSLRETARRLGVSKASLCRWRKSP